MNKKILKIVFLTFIIAIACSTLSFAEVEIKDTTDKITYLTVGDYYTAALSMNAEGSVMDSATVNVHMSNNKEWATVSYFSNGNYGTSGAGANTGVSITTNGNSHYTTNGNITGIMDWGKKYTFTAAVISNYADITSDTVRATGASLLNAIGTDSNIELFPESNNVEFGRNGWYSSWNYERTDIRFPYCVRQGLFGFHGGGYDYGVGIGNFACYYATGDTRTDTTFRPIFFNP